MRAAAVMFNARSRAPGALWLAAVLVLATLGFATQAQAQSWTTAGSMANGRSDHAAALLPSGRVLVAGGLGAGSTVLSSAELFDPSTGTWSSTGSLATARSQPSATLLANGKVLVAGGFGNVTNGYLASAELYDPVTGHWSAAASLPAPREGHTATLLPNGQVLVAGGSNISFTGLSSELYDPSTGTWSSAGFLATARTDHTATLLSNGQVLVASGMVLDGQGGEDTLPSYTASAELYNPALGTWSPTGSLATARDGHTATRLASGKVLVAGGTIMTSGGSTYFSSAEIYDPITGSWSAAPSLANPRWGHTSIALSSGQVLVAGGGNVANAALSAVELFIPAATAVPAVPAWGLLATFAGLCAAAIGLRRRRLPA